MNNPKVGDHIDDRYELRRQLGENEACTLFEALHRFTNRRVVMKLLRCSDSPEDPESLLLRDTFALGRIRHPYLVEVLDAGVSHSVPYVVTALLEGRSLDALTGRPLDPREVEHPIRIAARQIARFEPAIGGHHVGRPVSGAEVATKHLRPS